MAKKNKKNSYVFGHGQKKATLNKEQEFIFGVHYHKEFVLDRDKDNNVKGIFFPIVTMDKDDKKALMIDIKIPNSLNVFSVEQNVFWLEIW